MIQLNLKTFLFETEHCDYSHPSIQKIAKEFQSRFQTERELAVELFYLVRNKTLYTVGNWNKKASDTLRLGYGTCTNNANLLVALLRAVGIPAGYGVLQVRGREYFGPALLPEFKPYIKEESIHIYCYVYLNHSWFRCDPSDDEILSLNTQHFNPQSSVVDWDGASDAVLKLDPQHILKDEGPIDSIEELFKKKSGNKKKIPVALANIYIKFLRTQGKKVKKADETRKKFIWWLFIRHPVYFFIYKFLLLLYYFSSQRFRKTSAKTPLLRKI